MANRKISDLTALTAPATGDLLPIVDISEAAATDKNKKITIGELFASIPAGTAAAPSVAFEGDNTGIYSPGADQVAISTNGTGRLFVDSTGRVGIGTSALSYLLHVSKNGNDSQPVVLINNTNAGGSAATYFALGSNSTQNAGITLTSTAWGNYGLFKTQSAVLDAGGTASTFLGLAGQAGILFGVGSSPYSEAMSIDSSGRLLVGTSSNSGGALLQVNGDRIRIGTAKTPASATATGTTGEIAWDANYIYVCTATNTWKRTAIATW